MTLMSSLQMAANTLRVDQIALQVIGQNLANANTPGYIREEIQLAPAATQRYGGLLLGMGVEVTGIVQKIDLFLEDRLRGATSERASAEAQSDAFTELENLLNGLSDTDLATSMNEFFASISDILNQPESTSVRNLAILQGETLAGDIKRTAQRAIEARDDFNERIAAMGDRVNRLTEQIRILNIQIAETEGGDVSSSDAVGLRDQRLNALHDLASLINIRVEEQTSGGVTVYCGGEFLVADGVQRPVEVVYESRDGMAAASVHLAETDSPLNLSGGELYGLLKARDEIASGFINDLDEFARTFMHEFNKIFSSGQGLSGYQEVTSEFAVDDVNLPLNQAGLPFTPTNGSFQIVRQNTETGVTTTTTIQVDLNGIGSETTLASLMEQLNAIPGLSATTTNGTHLKIKATSPDEEFSFANDTSGLLASLGVNTFFSGSSSLDIGVNRMLKGDPGKFAASTGGVGADTENAIALAAFLDRPLGSARGATIAMLYDGIVADVTQGTTIAKAVTEGTRVFEETLLAQKASTSGVSIDEEAITLMMYQYSYQASARYITTIREIMDVLLQM